MTIYKSGSLPISVTFTANDTTLTTNIWKINNVQESTNISFTKSFNAYGTYNVTHEGANICGNQCPPASDTLILSATPQIPQEIIYGTLAVVAIAFGWALFIRNARKSQIASD